MSCDGRCCAVFTFPSSPLQLHQARKRYWSGEKDAETLRDMLVPLSVPEARGRGERFNLGGGSVDEIAEAGLNFYTCAHWDEETRRCTNYENRPVMCRDYPYAQNCVHCGWELPQADKAQYEINKYGSADDTVDSCEPATETS